LHFAQRLASLQPDFTETAIICGSPISKKGEFLIFPTSLPIIAKSNSSFAFPEGTFAVETSIQQLHEKLCSYY
jgi:hypothetical protein